MSARISNVPRNAGHLGRIGGQETTIPQDKYKDLSSVSAASLLFEIAKASSTVVRDILRDFSFRS